MHKNFKILFLFFLISFVETNSQENSPQNFTTSDRDNDKWIDGNKKYLQKIFKFYLFHLYLFFHKETALNYTLEAGGLVIVVPVTSMVSSRMISMSSIRLVLLKMRKKISFWG